MKREKAEEALDRALGLRRLKPGKGESLPRELKKRAARVAHTALTALGVPRRARGSRLGLRKRVAGRETGG